MVLPRPVFQRYCRFPEKIDPPYSIRILGVFPFDKIADVVAPRCELDPKLIIRAITFELIQPICPLYLNVTDGQPDRRTDGGLTMAISR